MTVRFVRPVSRAAYAGKWLAQAALLLLVLAGLAHRFGPLATPHFIALAMLSGAMAAASLPLAVAGLVRLWRVGAEAGTASAKALIFAALPLGVVLYGIFLYQTQPRLYDVTTDIADPPAWKRPPAADQIWLPRESVVSPGEREAQLEAYPGLTGRRYEGGLDRVYQAVLTVARANRIVLKEAKPPASAKPAASETPAPDTLSPATIPPSARRRAGVPAVVPIPLPRPLQAETQSVPGATGGDMLLQGETRTLVLGLPFDLVIRLSEEAETTFVDMRVAARFGPHDLGEGDAIAQVFLRALDAELLGIAPE